MFLLYVYKYRDKVMNKDEEFVMKTDFIYGKFINKDFCEKVINFFEDNHRIHRYDDKSNRSFSVMALKPFKFFK